MEATVAENSTPPSTDVNHSSLDVAPLLSDHEEKELKPKSDISAEEIKRIVEVIASTGKFWHDWDMLKSLLSFRLKQVLAEYPEAQVVSGDGPQQSSISGETYLELVQRLDEALLSFVEGPPFTLQRLCEILLDPKSTYRTLSKLALALEKNLLVTSTLTACTDPYPTAENQKPTEPIDKGSEEPQAYSGPVPNGVETVAADGDEEMADAEADEDVPNTDAEMREEKVPNTGAEMPEEKVPNTDTEMREENTDEALENSSEPSSDPDLPSEPSKTNEQLSSTTPQES